MLERARRIAPGETQQGVQGAELSRNIMEMVTTIMVYKFSNLSRAEVEAMLGLSLQETRVYQEARAEGRVEGRVEGEQWGRREEAASLVLRQLTRRLQQVSEQMRSQVASLSLPQLEALAEALLDFSTLADLEAWLAQQNP